MLKNGDVNPLNVWGLRQVSHLPPHFEPINFTLSANSKKITDWIWENLEGRFWYGINYRISGNGHLQPCQCAAFEVASEASMFALMLDQFNNYNQ